MDDENSLMKTRLDVAEMKGMLSQALADHGQRLTNLERNRSNLNETLSDKAKILATHREKIYSLERAINRNETELEELKDSIEKDISSRTVKIVSVITIIISGLTFFYTLVTNLI